MGLLLLAILAFAVGICIQRASICVVGLALGDLKACLAAQRISANPHREPGGRSRRTG